MRLGRRLSAGVAEHPPAHEHTEPAERTGHAAHTEPAPERAPVETAPAPRVPAELADR